MIKLVVFDAYGTLFDVYSVVELAETFYPKKGLELATLWREKQIEYTRLITEAGSQHLGATWYGFKTYWVNRYGLPFETIGPKPSKSGHELGEVISIVLS